MTEVPPAYTAGASPPSYDDIAKKLEDLIGDNPTPEKVIEASQHLSDEELDVLVDGADDHWPLETEQQKRDFSIGCGQAYCSEGGKIRLQEAGNEATQATKEIEDIFHQLHLKVAQIDQIHHSGFQPEIIRLQQSYLRTLADSRDLAASISSSAQNFDATIVRFCADNSIPVDIRRSFIESFIARVAGFEESATGIKNRFFTLKDEFAAFVATFSTWAKDREGEITGQIQALQQELDSLHKRLNSLTISLQAFEILYEVGDLIQDVGKFFPKIGGIILAGVSFLAIVGLTGALIATETKIHNRTREKHALEAKLELIRRTRAELEDLGEESLIRFGDAITILAGTWKHTAEDARIIQQWLADGADATHPPAYVELNRDYGVNRYEATAVYLENYARGVSR
ncbi:hypothetical protein BO78DRAFT_324209 [Aspergillus sclerotiicarbonarius CBS 121057]|uniref:Uncharacterized protein n=1 Tax=Aspergillus sclerotiicarbonarius (strain CBS 121057 / IBT 28362) TaxID=1448318 RepID=A0A319DYQ2_ASPSB|nr:hypothetical protein BO78DRAFT_324209 [Aspergillus sclerotiicarbonarius CBS 121057]